MRLARAEPFDLVVLDVMLPGLDGITVCRAVRRDSENIDTPILMLTTRRDESDKVLGLDSRADDYLECESSSPACERCFGARARPSRLGAAQTGDPVTIAGLTVDPARRQARALFEIVLPGSMV